MNDLGHEARTILEAARGAESLSLENRARIKRGVLLRVAVLGATSTVTGGAVAMSMATKITLAVVTVAALGGGAMALRTWKGRTAEAPASVRTRPTPTKAPTIPSGAPSAEAEPGVVATESEVRIDPRPETRRRDATRIVSRRPETSGMSAAEIAPAPAPALDPLDPELTVLRLAQEDLRAGLPARALRRLAEYDRRFGKGALEEERRAIAAIALCSVRPGTASRAQSERFLQSAPASPLAERVRTACEKSAETEK
jgi:hypothetical protein